MQRYQVIEATVLGCRLAGGVCFLPDKNVRSATVGFVERIGRMENGLR